LAWCVLSPALIHRTIGAFHNGQTAMTQTQ
jgi:hypothetical protein